MTNVLYTLAVVVALFGLTIFAHELGHYLAARACGFVIEVFAIGFGPAVWKRRVGGVLYKVGLLPFGGYVALPQMEPRTEERGTGGGPAPEHPPVSPWSKIVVAAAGAAGNLLLALLLAYVVFVVGKPSAPHERRCVVGYVGETSEAAAAGLQPGDGILAANGTPVGNWQDLLTILSLNSDETARLLVRGPAGEREVELPLGPRTLGARLPAGLMMEDLCRVGGLIPGGSAKAAGLRAGDLIVRLADREVFSRAHLVALVSDHADEDIPVVVQRGGERLTLSVRPQFDAAEQRPLIGILFSQVAVDYDTIVHPRPLAQLREHATAIFRFLRALVTPRESKAAAGAVGGPVSILYTYWQMVRGSFKLALWFTVFLNVNLGILNLLPIPVLDGGHILFSLWEGITRRPASASFVGWVYRIFATLLIGLFLLLTFRDARRWIVPLFRRDAPAAESPAPDPEPDPAPAAP